MSYQDDHVVFIKNAVDDGLLKELQDESLQLMAQGKKINKLGHNNYQEVSGYVINQNIDSKLIKFYRSDIMLNLVKNITGKDVKVCPLANKDDFNINCKLNYYEHGNENKFIDWHFDRSDSYQGDTVVVVLTLINTYPDVEGQRNFFYYKHGSITEDSVFTKQGDITMHNPDTIMHRVNEPDTVENNNMRVVFTMKYSTDPSPGHPILAIDTIFKYISIPLRKYTIYSYEIVIMLVFLLLLLPCGHVGVQVMLCVLLLLMLMFVYHKELSTK